MIFALLPFTEAGATAWNGEMPMNLDEAMKFCDNADLRPIEGLWTYPEDDVTVLIFRNENNAGLYDLRIIEAADCSLHPGMILGQLHASPDPDKFTLSLYTSVRKGVLKAPTTTLATFSQNKEALMVKRSSPLRFRFNPMRLLPSFWRIVSISVKSKESAPEGMIKIYPSYDGNGSTRRGPRYL